MYFISLNMPIQQQQQTTDGPAIIFEADPKITDIFTCKDGDYFGLVLVTNWPNPSSSSSSSSPSSSSTSSSSIDEPYQNFLKHVKKCFNTEDTISSSNVSASSRVPSWSTTKNSNLNSNDDDAIQQQRQRQQQQAHSIIPTVYLYPTIHLHITIATFLPPTKKKNNNNDDDDDDEVDKSKNKKNKKSEMIIINQIITLLDEASKLSDWPTQPFQFVIDSTQLGSKAGILLWKDLSGGINKIRNCLRQVVLSSTNNSASASTSTSNGTNQLQREEQQQQSQSQSQLEAQAQAQVPIFPPITIPRIIHSTFLRFSRIPKTCGKRIQERFQSEVIPNLHVCFNNSNNNSNNSNTDNDNDNTKTIDENDINSYSSNSNNNNVGMVIVSNTVNLVCESTPYMHIPADDQHIIWSKSLLI